MGTPPWTVMPNLPNVPSLETVYHLETSNSKINLDFESIENIQKKKKVYEK